MLFNSLDYAVFLPVVFALFWLLWDRYRWILILIVSYYFYMSWNVKYVVLILFTTFISWLCALLVERSETKKQKQFCMWTAIISSLAVLFFFKYFNFVSETVANICEAIAIPLHPVTLSVMLPVGISFYTFQSLSYVIDVYRGEVEAEHNFGVYAAFVSFFPQLVAGPIERSSNLLPQIQSPKKFDYDEAVCGLRIMMVGFFKKIVIADALGIFVDRVYNDIHAFQGWAIWMALFFFAFQIYCDFSGYSDIALGTAKLFGINLMQNFKSPYFARSVREFWSRWHISLSQWFRDYVYIPLGGNRCSAWKRSRNLMVTFLVSGLWHGANWTFVLWGGVHGALQIVERMVRPLWKPRDGKEEGPVRATVSTVVTFFLVLIAWNFFRANTLSDACYAMTHLWGGPSFRGTLGAVGMAFGGILKRVGCIGLLMVYDFFSLRHDLPKLMGKLKTPVRWGIYLAVTLAIIFLRPNTGAAQEFIYFQF